MYEQEQETEEVIVKRRKPRAMPEILDTPLRWLVRGINGNSVLESQAKPAGSRGVALMGTHEDQKHAEKRLGW